MTRLVALVAGCLALLVVALLAANVAPSAALAELIDGSLGSPSAISRTLRETTPLLIAGVAVFLALRAGLFNIGVEGQFLVGSVAAAWFAVRWQGFPGMLLAIIGGSLAGALWALPAGVIKAYRGGHEVITTIMLNSVALFFTTYLAAGPLKAPAQEAAATAMIADSTHIPNFFNKPSLEVNVALVIGILMVPALAFWLSRTVSGFEVRLVGANARAAKIAGVHVPGVMVRVMSASGAIAGIAGAFQVLAYEHRFYQDFSPGYGFDALGVALLAGTSAWGILPGAILFGLLNSGSASVSILGVPRGITGVILGLQIIVFAAFRYRKEPAIA